MLIKMVKINILGRVLRKADQGFPVKILGFFRVGCLSFFHLGSFYGQKFAGSSPDVRKKPGAIINKTES